MNDIERAKARKATKAHQMTPALACKDVADRIASGELEYVSHVLIITVHDTPDDETWITVTQGGELSALAAEGAVARAAIIMERNA